MGTDVRPEGRRVGARPWLQEHRGSASSSLPPPPPSRGRGNSPCKGSGAEELAGQGRAAGGSGPGAWGLEQRGRASGTGQGLICILQKVRALGLSSEAAPVAMLRVGRRGLPVLATVPETPIGRPGVPLARAAGPRWPAPPEKQRHSGKTDVASARPQPKESGCIVNAPTRAFPFAAEEPCQGGNLHCTLRCTQLGSDGRAAVLTCKKGKKRPSLESAGLSPGRGEGSGGGGVAGGPPSGIPNKEMVGGHARGSGWPAWRPRPCQTTAFWGKTPSKRGLRNPKELGARSSSEDPNQPASRVAGSTEAREENAWLAHTARCRVFGSHAHTTGSNSKFCS